ncbi:hypothetical protein BDV98DRAFT_4707 [Pterulicium gracile]|uniref:Uncharacterized protein n=1 Tax=Pterulicium gracile TaxID=1884261 RepID=A0A5C3R041_9AGAR|nr:hypothetical protein BDV98DRAFT_4707 [Pterula gracilis]
MLSLQLVTSVNADKYYAPAAALNGTSIARRFDGYSQPRKQPPQPLCLRLPHPTRAIRLAHSCMSDSHSLTNRFHQLRSLTRRHPRLLQSNLELPLLGPPLKSRLSSPR